jgi:hypothetical protein
MSMQIITHIITLHLHIIAHFIKGRGTDQVALSVDLPSDRRILSALLVGDLVASGGSSVDGNISAL